MAYVRSSNPRPDMQLPGPRLRQKTMRLRRLRGRRIRAMGGPTVGGGYHKPHKEPNEG